MQEIFDFLRELAAHNERPWFQAHRAEYDAAHAKFLSVMQDMIRRIAEFEPAVGNIEAKSTVFRIYRDVRFSSDKSPYKRHFGAYVNPYGMKSMHGGYYLHLQPGGSFVAGGCWWFEPKVLREVRESIALRLEEFEGIVEAPAFKKHFPVIGEDHLKTLPKGFPKDFPRPEYLRPRNYVVWENLPDRFFLQKGWEAKAAQRFRLMQPFINFVNDTVDDYI
ncbi:MAG: DUF2461 domain-containing protein [Alloprevotella sp.]|nr:DUF2461 domain-containing protein [Alloprevotella sp.]MBR1652332.1 DUF2461 domain-containing protein [Alloprevotella sp.]